MSTGLHEPDCGRDFPLLYDQCKHGIWLHLTLITLTFIQCVCVFAGGGMCAQTHRLIDWCDVTVFWHVVTHSFPNERMSPAAFGGETPTAKYRVIPPFF